MLFPSFPMLTTALIHDSRWGEVDLTRVSLTEAAGVVSFNELTDTLDERSTTCGRPFSGIEIRIVDPETGEPRGAFVELHDGAEITADELVEYCRDKVEYCRDKVEYCRDKIASFKAPRYVRFVTEWPYVRDEDPEVSASGVDPE